MNIVLCILFYLLIFFLIRKWSFFRNSGISQKKLQTIFLIKFGIGLFLTWVYIRYYPIRSEADIFKYFDDSEVMYNALKKHPADFFKMLLGYDSNTSYFFDNYYVNMNNWDREYDSNLYNDSHTIIRINALLRIFSFGVFHIHTLLFSLFSMIGLTAIYRVIQEHFSQKKNALLICLFLLPSVLFWSSGVLKEAILLLGMGLLIYAAKNILLRHKTVAFTIVLLLSLFLLFYIKFYVLIVLLPAFIAWTINSYWNIKKSILTYLVITLFGTIAIFNVEKVVPQYNFKEILVQKQKDFKGLATFMESGSRFELTDLQPNFTGIVKVAPEAVINCFIRPLPAKNTSLLQWIAILENGFILLLAILAITSFIKVKPDYPKNLFWLGITFTLLLFVIIGLTTPVAGALVRYKVPALPFLAMSLLLLIDLDRIVQRIPFLKILR